MMMMIKKQQHTHKALEILSTSAMKCAHDIVLKYNHKIHILSYSQLNILYFKKKNTFPITIFMYFF